ncbi:ABC-three component system middle component 5 [Aeromonas sp. 602826]|uniref:ABC-three component system middle component 5 n=1 Tax=Aeromonas sp. 602826 TaxID=2712044 RepID=UPI003BA24AEE
MLLYNKALDANHALLRMTALLISWKTDMVEGEALRMFDFLIANPAHIEKLSLPKDEFIERKVFKSYRNRYQNFEPKSLFNAMKDIHFMVIERFVEIGILRVDKNTYSYHVELDNIPNGLRVLAESKENSISKQAIEFIVANLTQISVTGPAGLKKITSLMDYKYDVN